MRLSDLQGKDIVDLTSGKRIGNIIDVLVSSDGKIESLIVEKRKVLSIFSGNNDIEIKWEEIDKIGEDVILVVLLKK